MAADRQPARSRPAPTSIPAVDLLLDRTRAADPELADALGIAGLRRDAAAAARGPQPATPAPRRRRRLGADARGLRRDRGRSGWRVDGRERRDDGPAGDDAAPARPRRSTRSLVGAGDPPARRRARRASASSRRSSRRSRPGARTCRSSCRRRCRRRLDVFGDVGARPGEVMLAPAARQASAGAIPTPGSARRPPARAGPAGRRPATGARRAARAPSPTCSTGGSRPSCWATTPAARAVASPAAGGEASRPGCAVVPRRRRRAGRPRRRRRRRRPRVVHGAGRPAPRPRPDARAADRAVGRRGRRGRRAADGRRAGGPRSARRGDDPTSTTAPCPTSWSRRAASGHGARRRRSRSPIVDVMRRPGRQPVRARPRAAPRRRSGRSPTTASARSLFATSSTTCSPRSGSVVTPAGLRAGRAAGQRRRPRGGRDERARPRAGRPRAGRPAARARGGRRVPVPRPGPARRPRPPFRGRRRRRARRARWSTCATSRCACRIAPIDGATCWRPGSPRCGRGRRVTDVDTTTTATSVPTPDAARRRPAADRSVRLRRLVEGPVDVTLPAGAGRPRAGRAPASRSCPGRRSSSASATPRLRRRRRRRSSPTPRRRGGRDRRRRAAVRLARSLARRRRRGHRADREPGRRRSSARCDPGAAIVVQASGRALARHRRAGRADPRPAPRRRRRSRASCAAGRLDVGLAGTILVVGSRIDAETLTRARAMGVRGIVVGRAGEQGAARLPRLGGAPAGRAPPAAAVRRARPRGGRPATVAGPVMDVLEALEGHDVAIVADPPMLIFDVPDVELPVPPTRPRAGPGRAAGRSRGHLDGLVGPRRFAGGVHLEAGTRPLRRRLDWSPSRSATSNGSDDRDDRPDRRPARRDLPRPGRDDARSAARSGAVAARRAISSACGATSGRARHTSPRRSAPALGVTDTITSPSFILMAEYEGRLPLFHLDPYRLAERRGRARRRAHRRAPGDRRHARRVAGAARRRAPARRLDVRIDGTGDEPRTITLVAWTRSLPTLPGGRRMSHDGRRPAILAIDTATTHVVIATGSPDGRRRRDLDLARRLPPRRDAAALDRAVPRRTEHPTIAADAGSSSGRGRARSPGCGWGSRPPRAWPMGWACPSRACRPPRRCSPPRASQRAVLLLPAGPSDRLIVRTGRAR